MKVRTGIYGGTFNPIHLGHLRAAEEVREALALERMVFVPSARPPHKTAEELIAPAELRHEWTRLAIEDNPGFEVDDLELRREGPSYSVETLRALAERLGETPVFAIGADAFVEMDSWREPEQIFELAHVAVTTRPPMGKEPLERWLPECIRDAVEIAPDGTSARHRRAGTWIRQVALTALDISASEVRERLRTRRSTRYLLPEKVRVAVEASGFYSPSRARLEDAP